MRRRPLIAGAVTATVVVAAAGCAGGHHRSDAALRHQYFVLGKRVCANMLQPKGLDAGLHDLTVWGPFIGEIRGIPARYQEAVQSGCAAAPQHLPPNARRAFS